MLVGVLLACGLACNGGEPTAEQDAHSRVDAQPTTPSEPEDGAQPEDRDPDAAASESETGDPVQPATRPEPPPSFDPLTATRVRVRLLVVHDKFWSACGVIHSVGAIEVEVLDVGEPPPRLVLYVSCPVDVGRGLLEVGKVLDVSLHQRRQPWPKPPVELPDGVPVRYVSSLSEVVALGGVEQ